MIDKAVSWGDIFTGLAFLLSCFATGMTLLFNHRQKALIESQKRLNDMLLRQGERDAQAAAKADLGASLIKLGGGNYRFKVFNKGKATARDVRIDFPEGNDLVIDSEIADKFPLEALEQHQSVDLIAAVHLGTRQKHVVRLTWSDDAADANAKTVYVTL